MPKGIIQTLTPGNDMKKNLTKDEQQFLLNAKKFMEGSNLLLDLTNKIGMPLEWAITKLPEKATTMITAGVQKALLKSLKVALHTVPNSDLKDIQLDEALKLSTKGRWIHNAGVGFTGGVGGLFSEIGFLIELPISTSLIMRNIASKAQIMGMDPKDPRFAFECLYIFSLGSKSKKDDEMDSAYYSSRYVLSNAVASSAEFLAGSSAKFVLESIEKGSAPALLSFIAKVAGYFEVVVTRKMLAELVPVVGAAGGAGINILFNDFFGQAAHYHFGIKKLERMYGEDVVNEIYLKLDIHQKAV